MSDKDKAPSISLLPILSLLQGKVIYLSIFVFIGLLAGFLISKSITPLYESFVVLYPSNSNSRAKQLEEFSFGHEVHSERLMQLLASNILLDSLENRFGLVKHYGIDQSDQNWYDQFLAEVKDRIEYHKTKYVSVVVSVKDHEPEMAAKIANASAELVNTINANIVKEGAKSSLEAVKMEFESRQDKIYGMNDSIVDLRSDAFGELVQKLRTDIDGRERRMASMRHQLDEIRRTHNIYDFGYQINVLNEQLADAQASFLQEEGSIQIMESGEMTNDSLIANAKARRNGAQSRKDYFQTQLNSLVRVNDKYSSITEQLEEEVILQKNTRAELQKLGYTVEPTMETHRIKALEDDFEFDQMQMKSLRSQYQNALSNYLEPVPMAYVISPARASYKKIYPYTLVNIVIGGIATGLFGLFLLAFMERRKTGK